MEQTHSPNLATALGVVNERELVLRCIELAATKASCSDILKALVCSELDTKQLVYCAFISGRMQEMDEETASFFVLKYKTEKLWEEIRQKFGLSES